MPMTRHPVEEGRVRSKIYSDKPYRAVNSSSEQGQDITQREDKNAGKVNIENSKALRVALLRESTNSTQIKFNGDSCHLSGSACNDLILWMHDLQVFIQSGDTS